VTVTIRDATALDAPAIAALLAELDHPASETEIRARLERLALAGPGDRVLVAVADGRVAGMAVLHETPMLHRPTDVGRVTALVVRADVRGRGIGAALVRAAEDILAARGCTRLEITSAHTRAHPFYRRAGYADEGVRFARKLPRP